MFLYISINSYNLFEQCNLCVNAVNNIQLGKQCCGQWLNVDQQSAKSPCNQQLQQCGGPKCDAYRSRPKPKHGWHSCADLDRIYNQGKHHANWRRLHINRSRHKQLVDEQH